MARERTFAAWVRTGLAPLAIGLGLVKLMPDASPRWLIQVLFTLILSGIVLHDRPSAWQKIGIGIAFVGIVLLIVDRYETASFTGMLFVLGAGLAWAVSNILMKLSGNIDMLRLMIWMSLVPPLPLALLSFVLEEGQVTALSNISLTGLGAIFYTGLISSVLAYSLWGKLFQRYSANLVAPFALLVPIFGTLFSFVLLDESLSFLEIVACQSGSDWSYF